MKVIYVTAESYFDHSYSILNEMRKHINMPVYLQAKEMTEEISAWCKKFNAVFVKRNRFRNPFSLFSEISMLLKIRRQNPDVVWFNTLTVYQVFLVRLLIKKYLVVMHDVELHPESKDRHASLSVRLTLKYHKKNICVVSKTQAELFQKQFGIKPLVFQLPIINYYREQGKVTEVKRDDGIIKFFFFGTVEHYKGIETLIEAFEILAKKQLPPYKLTIYGRLKYDAENLSKRITALPNAEIVNKFIDYKDVHSIYNSNDVLMLPYRQVTQCGPLLIGFSENVPSVCSDLPGFREYVEDGRTGIIFNNTSEGLAEKLEELLTQQWKINGLKTGVSTIAKENFSMEKLFPVYISNFKKAAGIT